MVTALPRLRAVVVAFQSPGGSSAREGLVGRESPGLAAPYAGLRGGAAVHFVVPRGMDAANAFQQLPHAYSPPQLSMICLWAAERPQMTALY